ncbi:MAG: hypothetical protein QGM50_00875 [Anaerolineae bacterium]|nr:hypothetical protein [Anaerolineae bacterium]MDK1117319.1 hypothetical protein [Anaerolineae bacterium]
MNSLRNTFRSKEFPIFLILSIIAGLVYLPFIRKIGYLNDDWYLMYSAGAKGASVFTQLFSVDRPLRALVMSAAYTIYGADPLWYNLSAFFFRLLSAFGFLWLLMILWPRQIISRMLMALLFLIYPGFLSQLNGIDYQSQMVSLAAAVFSIALTVKMIQANRRITKFSLGLTSGLLAWMYMGLVEYFIGFELIRLACIFLLVARKKDLIGKHITQTIRLWLPALFFLISFLIWRLFIFEAERGATDVGQQLGLIIQSPLTTSLRWLGTLLLDSLDVTILAWGRPISFLFPWITSRNLLLGGIGMSLLTVAILMIGWKRLDKYETKEGSTWLHEALWLGLFWIVAGLLPIILVNRSVDFNSFSRYTLASSFGAAMFLVALISSLSHIYLRRILIAGMVAIASLTHFANSQKAIQITQATNNFWWQVSWRIPHLEKNTTLIANYAVGATDEDYFVWGPANLIYYPDGTKEQYVQPGIYAALLNQGTVINTLNNVGQEYDYRRTIRTYKNYRRLLLLTQPAKLSCVQVIDGRQPEFSKYENASIQTLGPYSNLEYILINNPGSTPPSLVFGSEPEHGWCYFYQKASLARQLKEWEEIQLLGDAVFNQNLAPGDSIEWMPFLQAYAHLGEVERLKEVAPDVIADPYIAQQACRIMGDMNNLTHQVRAVIESHYCVD